MPNSDKPTNPISIQCTGKAAIGEFPAKRGCGNFFPFKDHLRIEDVAPKDQVKRLYIRCPYCGTKYTVDYSDKTIEQLKAEIKKLTPREENNPKREQLGEQIKAEQQRLKELYGI